METGHFSSASAKSVWLVYPNTSTVVCQASSHGTRFSSTRTRISSATPMAGWVSLSWMATFLPNWVKSAWVFRYRRTMSAMEQATKKYSCLRRSSLPAMKLSLG